jgi:hypothetical protein
MRAATQPQPVSVSDRPRPLFDEQVSKLVTTTIGRFVALAAPRLNVSAWGKEMLMPRALFGDVTDPSISVGTRKWYSVPLSFAVHALVTSILIVTPLLATGALPMPASGRTIVHIEPPPLPQPPPVRAVTPASPPTVSHNAAPVVAPDDIRQALDIDAGFERETAAPIGIIGGGEIEISGAVVAPPAAAPPRWPSALVCKVWPSSKRRSTRQGRSGPRKCCAVILPC